MKKIINLFLFKDCGQSTVFLTSVSIRNRRNNKLVGEKTVNPVSLQKMEECPQNFCQLTVTFPLSTQIDSTNLENGSLSCQTILLFSSVLLTEVRLKAAQ